VCAAVSCALALMRAGGGAFAFAQGPRESCQPTEGQLGKDVVWEPSSAALVETVLDLAGVTARNPLIGSDHRNALVH
jgi:hypothetical protein